MASVKVSGKHSGRRRYVTATEETWERWDYVARISGFEHTSRWMMSLCDAEADRVFVSRRKRVLGQPPK